MLERFRWFLVVPLMVLLTAQAPVGTIKIIVPFGPGGTGDLAARSVGQRLSVSLGQPVIIENSVSAFGIRAAEMVAQSPADGKTLLLAGGNFAASPFLYKSLPFKETDFRWVSLLGRFSQLLVTDSDSPLKTVGDIIAAAKAEPAKFNFGTGAVGSIPHLLAVMFTSAARLDNPSIPFRSTAEIVIALKGGQVQVGIDALPALLPQLASGSLRAVAVADPAGAALLPGVPPISQALPGVEAIGWNALAVPANTPTATVQFLSSEVQKALADPDVQKRLSSLGLDPAGSSPEQVEALYVMDRNRWRAVIEKNNIRLQ